MKMAGDVPKGLANRITCNEFYWHISKPCNEGNEERTKELRTQQKISPNNLCGFLLQAPPLTFLGTTIAKVRQILSKLCPNELIGLENAAPGMSIRRFTVGIGRRRGVQRRRTRSRPPRAGLSRRVLGLRGLVKERTDSEPIPTNVSEN